MKCKLNTFISDHFVDFIFNVIRYDDEFQMRLKDFLIAEIFKDKCQCEPSGVLKSIKNRHHLGKTEFFNYTYDMFTNYCSFVKKDFDKSDIF